MQMIEVLKAIAEDTRMKIITMLLDGSLCVGCMAKRLGISEAAVSQHIKVLRRAGLVTGRRKGYFIHYSLEKEKLLMLAKELERLAEGKTAEGSSLCGHGRCGKGECRCRKM